MSGPSIQCMWPCEYTLDSVFYAYRRNSYIMWICIVCWWLPIVKKQDKHTNKTNRNTFWGRIFQKNPTARHIHSTKKETNWFLLFCCYSSSFISWYFGVHDPSTISNSKASSLIFHLYLLPPKLTWLAVSTHLKNMLAKLDHLPR